MNFDSYQQIAATYRAATVPDEERVFGLFEEAGEVAGIYKRIVRGDYKDNPAEANVKLKKELGDVLWYLSQVALDNGFALSDVAELNISKLEDRRQRNVLLGSGDNR